MVVSLSKTEIDMTILSFIVTLITFRSVYFSFDTPSNFYFFLLQYFLNFQLNPDLMV